MPACSFIFLTLSGIDGFGRIRRRWCDVGGQLKWGAIEDEIGFPAVYPGEVQLVNLVEELLPAGAVEPVPEGQEVCLAIFF